MKRALILGITGQDGSLLAQHLLMQGYHVFGFTRASSSRALLGTDEARIDFVYGDMTDSNSISSALEKVKPDEIYNLAAQSFQPSSWTRPVYTMDVNATGVMRLLDAVETVCPQAKVFQASAAGMFGAIEGPVNEYTQAKPQSPYEVAKLAAHQLCQSYRNRGLQISTGILFSHESPRRGLEMVTRKISSTVARWVARGETYGVLKLGNIDTPRDAGYAPEFVMGMHKILQVAPDDFVLGTGTLHTVRDFLLATLKAVGVSASVLEHALVQDASLMRSHTTVAYADATKANNVLGWQALTPMDQIASIMVHADLARLKCL